MNENVSGLMTILQQCVSAAILESEDVAARVAALRCPGSSPVFTVDISLRDVLVPEPVEALGRAEALVLNDEDVAFLAIFKISDPSWSTTS
jgi:hypothetical protein